MSKYCIYEKYRILAKRSNDAEWSTWTTTNDPNNIRKHLNRIEELGYEASVADPKITEWEKKRNNGYLLFNPVKPGQLVCSLIDKGEDSYIENWIVKCISYDGEKWYAINESGVAIEVGSQQCMSIKAAHRLLKELKGESEDDV